MVWFAISLGAATVGQPDVIDPITFRILNQQLIARNGPVTPGRDKLVGRSAETAPIAARSGEIALLDTGGGVFQQAFPFDLDGQTLTLEAAGVDGRYTIALGSSEFVAGLGQSIAIGDDDSTRLELGFEFPFYGQAYSAVWLNSDGNLTFDGPDVDTSLRDAARVLTGGPRICPLFSDLDPTVPGATVAVQQADDELVVSWLSVPPFTDTRDGVPQTFQVSLNVSGTIKISYADVSLNSAVVGLGSGDRVNEARAVDFNAEPEGEFSGSVIEVFQDAVLDLAALSQGFYREFEDAYDFLVIFHEFDLGFESDSFAFYLPVRNSVLGIGFWPPPLEGRNIVEIGDFLGSPRRLQGLMFMGLLDKYPEGPQDRIGAEFGLGLNTPMTVLAHEAAHRFLARVLFIDESENAFSTEMLGRQLGHWSYFFNSDGSLLEGNRIVDHGTGEFRFETVATIDGFSSLDMYLMGLLPPDEVGDTFLVRNPDIADNLFTAAHEPLAGVFFNGERIDISIDDVVAAHGRRVPGPEIAQRDFRYAFLLVHDAGSPPAPESLAKIEGFRAAFGEFFGSMTAGRAKVDTGLKRELAFSTWPAVGLLAGDMVDIAAFRPTVGAAAIPVALSSDSDAVLLPGEVTIPSGSDFVRIPVEATAEGLARIEGFAGDDFEIARSAIRVHGSTAELRAVRILPLELFFGDPRERLQTSAVGQPLPYRIFAQVVDNNLLAIPNAAVTFTASGDGIVSETSVLSDSFGFVAVEWILASRPGLNELRISIPGSTQSDVVVEAMGTRSPLRQRNLRRRLFGN